MKKRVSCALLCLWTLCALSVHADTGAQTPAAALPDGAVWALGACALWALYRRWLRTEGGVLRPKRLWALAALFAGVMTLGQSFQATGTAEWVSGHKAAALLYFSGRVPLYAAAMRLGTDALCAQGRAAGRRLRSWQWGVGLLACWLPWYVCLFPGTVSNDSISQLMSVLGLAPLTNANPVCQTGLTALFRVAGLALGGSADAGVALYCMVQATLMAWLLGALLQEMRTNGASGGLVWASFAFYALCPIFPVFAFCVGKDTNFAMAVLFMALETRRITLRGASGARTARLSIAAVACVLLRNPGVYLALMTAGMLLVWTLRHRKSDWRAPACAMASAAAVFAALHLAVLPMLDIAPMPQTEEYSIPLQQVARVAAGGGLTEAQTETLAEVLPVEKLRDAYNGELSDPVKDLWYQDASEQSTAAFFRTWLSVVRSHPMTCFSATFHNTYGYVYPGYVSTIKPTLILGDQTTRTASVRGYYDFSVNPLSVRVKAFTERLNRNVLYRLLVSPGAYGWLTVLCMVWLLGKKGTGEWVSAVPVLFTLAGCLLSAVNGYFRYAMPLYLNAPLLLWLIQSSGKDAKMG